MPERGDDTGVDPSIIRYEADVAHATCRGDDIDYRGMTFFRNKNPNGLAPALTTPDGEKPWLRLAVARDAYLDATAGDPGRCDRCELRDGKLPLGTPVWYSFEMRAERGFPLVDARCVCAQIKAPYYDDDGGSPMFALRIDHGRYLATIEHLYESSDVDFIDGSEIGRCVTLCTGRVPNTAVPALDHHVFGNTPRDFKELQVRALFATDSGGLPAHLNDEFRWCTSLVTVEQHAPFPDDIFQWHRFVIRVAPTSVKDEDGIIQLSVTDPLAGEERLIAMATGEFGHAGSDDPGGNTGPPPGGGLQYFKIGPYRDKLRIWGDAVAAVHVRNIKRGYWAEGAALRAGVNQIPGLAKAFRERSG